MILHTKDYSTQFIYDSYSGNDRVAFFETWCTLHYDSIAAFLHAISEMQQQATTQFFYRLDALPAAQPTVSKH